jgi:hypothetical protein
MNHTNQAAECYRRIPLASSTTSRHPFIDMVGAFCEQLRESRALLVADPL